MNKVPDLPGRGMSESARRLEVAAKGSAPAPGGRPIEQPIEVREVMRPIEH